MLCIHPGGGECHSHCVYIIIIVIVANDLCDIHLIAIILIDITIYVVEWLIGNDHIGCISRLFLLLINIICSCTERCDGGLMTNRVIEYILSIQCARGFQA